MSVVIPCYRQAVYLAEAVESVVGQTYRDWEIVIVDDGSPDDAATVAGGLIAAHPDRPMRLIRQNNLGLAAARNAGIAASSGRYILPLDADDLLMPEMLHRTVGLLDAEPGVAIAYTDFEHFGADRRRVRVGVWDIEALAYSNQLGICSLFRREVWAAVGGYNPNMARGYEDWDFWIGAAERGFQARHIAEPLFRYRLKVESRDTVAWGHRRALRRQLARNHPSVYSRRRRLRYAVRRGAGALRYRAASLVGRLLDGPRRGAA